MKLHEIHPSAGSLLIELAMNYKTYSDALSRTKGNVNVGFEFEMTFDDNSPLLVDANVTARQKAESMRVRDADAIDIENFFRTSFGGRYSNTVGRKIEEIYHEYIHEQAEDYANDHWKDYVEDDPEEEEDDAWDRAYEDYIQSDAPSIDHFVQRIVGPGDIIDTLSLEPIYGWVDEFEEEFYIEEVDDEVDREELVEYLIGEVRDNVEDDVENIAEVKRDGSVTAPGIEITTHPVPLDEAIDTMNQMFTWMNKNDAITDESTGMHINIDIENMEQLDPLKLVLFLGDEYILKLFDRINNAYTKSQLQEILRRIRDEGGRAALSQIQGMSPNRILQYLQGRLSNQRVSSNIGRMLDDGYIEFRMVGGVDYHNMSKTIENVIYRIATAMIIATDRELYKKDYLKKAAKVFDRAIDPPESDSRTRTPIDDKSYPPGIAKLFKQHSDIYSLYSMHQNEPSAVNAFDMLAKTAKAVNPTTLTVQDVKFLRQVYRNTQQLDKLQNRIREHDSAAKENDRISTLLRFKQR